MPESHQCLYFLCKNSRRILGAKINKHGWKGGTVELRDCYQSQWFGMVGYMPWLFDISLFDNHITSIDFTEDVAKFNNVL